MTRGAAAPSAAARGAAVRELMPRLLLALGLAVALCYTTSHVDLSSPNERSRLYLTVALFEHHGFAIDQVRSQFGAVFDEASHAGHYFTDKAPGASLLALVPYAVMRLFVDAKDVTLPLLLGIGRYAVVVPFGVIAFYALEALCSALGMGRAATRFASLAFLFGTPAFHYSAAFFGHQIVGTTLLLSLLLIVNQSSMTPWLETKRHPLAPRSPAVALPIAGFLAGLAGITEYQASIGILGLCASVVVLSPGRRLRALGYFALGGLPSALLLAYYHNACFGGPFELSYHHLSHMGVAEVHRQGIGGVGLPTIAGLRGSLFSLHRGLLATSPHLLFSFFGAWCLTRRGHGALALCLAVTALGYLGFVASSATWEAGWGYGCRLLIPALPILSLFVAAALDHAYGAADYARGVAADGSHGAADQVCGGVEHARRGATTDVAYGAVLVWGLAWSALLVSVSSFQATTALFAEPPNELKNPWLDVIVPLASKGIVAPNLGSSLFGLTGHVSVLPLLVLLGILFGAGMFGAARSAGARGTVGAAGAAAARGSARRWLLAAPIPVIPALWLLLVNAQGPSGTSKQRAEFVDFVRTLYAGSFSPRGR